MLTSLLGSLLLRKVVKAVLFSILEAMAAATDTKVDDKIVADIKKALK